MPTTTGRSRGRQGVHSGAQGAVGDHMRKIMATMVAADRHNRSSLLAPAEAVNIDAATQRFHAVITRRCWRLVGLSGSGDGRLSGH